MALFVTGTGTDVGKTVFSALVMARYGKSLALRYLKPVQTGADSDRDTVQSLSALGSEYFLPELFHFNLAASPHFAAESEEKAIDVSLLSRQLREHAGQNTVIELAGGLMVPLARYTTNLDLIRWVGFPAVLVAATGLGTINHTVLSIQALKAAGIEPAGIYFIGHDNPLCADNMRTIIDMTGANLLGSFFLPAEKLTPAGFLKAAENFDREQKMARLFL